VVDKSNSDLKKQKYICCQAPLSSTFNDFWRMVWEQRVPVIVMITNLVEKNRVKADAYWPKVQDQTLCYDGICVKNVAEKKLSNNIIVRIFKIWKSEKPSSSENGSCSINISNNTHSSSNPGTPYQSDEDLFRSGEEIGSDPDEPPEGQEVRQVVQLHCTDWPDFGVPKSTTVTTDLLDELDIRKKALEDPIVVHCSAGIGRTGTFVAIHMSIQKHSRNQEINIKDTVQSLRSQRLGMVQSKEQYMFVYNVVAAVLARRQERSIAPQIDMDDELSPLTDRQGRKTKAVDSEHVREKLIIEQLYREENNKKMRHDSVAIEQTQISALDSNTTLLAVQITTTHSTEKKL
jgi:protein tyrosine phosphatase